MRKYTPGLHILATFSAPADKLTAASDCQMHFDSLIHSLGLTKVGEAYHSFPNSGFTAVVCLTESHISIHTWPEFGLATFDVFLSNFLHDNTDKVHQFYSETLLYFKASVLSKTELTR